MGTVLELDLRGLERPRAEALARELFESVRRRERVFSRFDPDAGVARLNAVADGDWHAVDPELAELVERSCALAQRTRGSFDISVGPLVELWTAAGRSGELPGPAALARARDRVGAQQIRVQRSPARIALEPGMSVDLGGIAKGFALDRLVPALRRSGVRAALLSFGGSSLQALGAPAGAPGWRVLIEDPDAGVRGTVLLRDRALSISSSLGQSSTIGGRRYGHVIDPRSGEPITQGRLAAVLAPSGTDAEALSLALLLLSDREAGEVLAAFPDAHGMRVESDGRRWFSPGWLAASQFAPLP